MIEDRTEAHISDEYFLAIRDIDTLFRAVIDSISDYVDPRRASADLGYEQFILGVYLKNFEAGQKQVAGLLGKPFVLSAAARAVESAVANLRLPTQDERFMLFCSTFPVRYHVELERGWAISRATLEQCLEKVLFDSAELLQLLEPRDSTNRSDALPVYIPQQKLGPMRFELVDSKIILLRTRHDPKKIDEDNVETARAHLIRSGGSLLTSLEDSNCDKRFVAFFRGVHEAIETRANIIEVGLLNVGLAQMCEQYSTELPAITVGQLRAHVMNIDSYTAQFPAWNRFSENALWPS